MSLLSPHPNVLHCSLDCISPLAGTWVLDELERQYPRDISASHPPADAMDSDMSGVEAVSPHKLMAAAHESPLEIPEIGNIATSWVGLKGVQDIKRLMEEKEGLAQAKALKSELRVLAKECLTAFEVAGLKTSEEPQIQKAVSMCESYLPRSSSHRTTTSSAIASLWREEAGPSTQPCYEDKEELASAVLGEKLVGVLTQKDKQPPDVSVHSLLCPLVCDTYSQAWCAL